MWEDGILIAWALGLVTLCVVAWGTNFIALPGNWFAVALVVLYVWLGPESGRVALAWPTAAAAFGAAAAGEIFEMVAAAFGAQRAGASRRATLYALAGSLVGALLGAVIGIPIPFVGSLVAALLFGALGATAGAMIGEWTNGKSWRESWAVGHAAFWGRMIGTLGKLFFGAAIIAIVIVGLVVD